MLTIILLMLAGLITGHLLTGHIKISLGRVITVLIWVLLFTLGLEVGGNEKILGGRATIGTDAIVIALLGTLGSMVAAAMLWRHIKSREEREEDKL